MPDYTFQYRREQRVTFRVWAKTEDEANKAASEMAPLLDLKSTDDESDDQGELELLEVDRSRERAFAVMRLNHLEAALAAAGGRGEEIAEEIDELRARLSGDDSVCAAAGMAALQEPEVPLAMMPSCHRMA